MTTIVQPTPTKARTPFFLHTILLMLIALAALPFLVLPLGLTVSLSTEMVVNAIFALAFNLLLGYTGMVSSGHVAYWGMGAHAAVLAQKHLLPGDIVLCTFIGGLSALVLGIVLGALMVRARRVLLPAFPGLLLDDVHHHRPLDRRHRGRERPGRHRAA